MGQTDEFPEVAPTEGWNYAGPWEVDCSMSDFDSEGWVYSTSFLDLDLGHYSKFSSATVVRRKRWMRKMIPVPSEEEDFAPREANVGILRTPDRYEDNMTDIGTVSLDFFDVVV